MVESGKFSVKQVSGLLFGFFNVSDVFKGVVSEVFRCVKRGGIIIKFKKYKWCCGKSYYRCDQLEW